MRPLIEVEDVTKLYGGMKKLVTAIDNIKFHIFPQEIVSILGPSGCGKTTILRLLCNVIQPTKGKISFNNKDISYAIDNRLIGVVPQTPTLLPNRNVWQNINLPLEIKKRENNKDIQKMISLMGLIGFEKYFPHQLSGGMKQRVSLARALIYEPSVLLMDEPFSSLDEIIKEKLHLEVLRIHKRLKPTIVFVTHSIEEAVFISNRVIVMSTSPNRVVDEVGIDFPDVRDVSLKNKEEFFDKVVKVRNLLRKAC